MKTDDWWGCVDDPDVLVRFRIEIEKQPLPYVSTHVCTGQRTVGKRNGQLYMSQDLTDAFYVYCGHGPLQPDNN